MAVDTAALDRLEARIRAGEFSNVHGVLIQRAGHIIAEWYFPGGDHRRDFGAIGQIQFGPGVAHDIRSVTKSVVSLLVGVAQGEGLLTDLDEPVLAAFPEHADLATPERRQIRLRHLLSMTSGLRWDESLPYSDLRNSETAMDAAPDRIRYVLEQPIVRAPGERFVYSGGDLAVVAELLRRRTGKPIDVYATEKLFGPLGITNVAWMKDRQGVPFAASGLRMRPRDMLKLGTLVLQQGRWQTTQVVPERWIAESTKPHTHVSGDATCGLQYGYFWYVGTQCDGSRRNPWVAAFGNGGQRIAVAPADDTVVVVTAGLYNDPAQGRVANGILAATFQAMRHTP